MQATFDPEDGEKLLSGMFTRLNVALATEYDQIVVPQVAVSYNMYGESLYILTALSDEEKEKFASQGDVNKMVVRSKSRCLPKIAKAFILS